LPSLQPAILGLVRGLSEFLPISSSGHLVIFQGLLGVNAEDIYLEVALHFGTLVAVLVYFRRDLAELVAGTARYLGGNRERENFDRFYLSACILIGTIPVAIGGVLLKDYFEAAFESTVITGAMLLVTGLVLFLTRLAGRVNGAVNLPRAVVIGIAQLASVLPGISRSGATISTAIYLKVDPSKAARFSFLLSIPAVAAAFLLKVFDLAEEAISMDILARYLLGTVVAFAVGLFAIHILLKLVASYRLYYFGFWCVAAGLLTLIYIR
jgi:undecaprenyl-diphosphatase